MGSFPDRLCLDRTDGREAIRMVSAMGAGVFDASVLGTSAGDGRTIVGGIREATEFHLEVF